MWTKAVQALAFDIARGWLPASLLTNLSWSSTLRKANEYSLRLEHHPLQEVRNIGTGIRAALYLSYPNSTYDPASEVGDDTLTGLLWSTDRSHMTSQTSQRVFGDAFVTDDNDIRLRFEASRELKLHAQWLANRPNRKAALPWWTNTLATITMYGLMDYGTWRDLQRHRLLVQRPPVLRGVSLHTWYTDQLFHYIGVEGAYRVVERTEHLFKRTSALPNIDAQYAYPIGTSVPIMCTTGLVGAVYFAELRSSETVHPILRPWAQKLGDMLMANSIPVWASRKESHVVLRRGTQDIVEKP
jgi:hypothetical protein